MIELLRHELVGTETLIFDLDDTLYPHGHFLSDEYFMELLNTYASIACKISLEEAKAISQCYIDENAEDPMFLWEQEHGLNLDDVCLFVDQQDISHLKPCPQINKFLADWQGKAVVFTNAHKSHAERLLEHLHIEPYIEYTCDRTTRNERMKPDLDIYHELLEKIGEDPKNCIMFEDKHTNLAPAHDMGMATVLVHPKQHDEPHVDFWYPNLPTWVKNTNVGKVK